MRTVGPKHQVTLEKDGVLMKQKVNAGQLKLYLQRATTTADDTEPSSQPLCIPNEMCSHSIIA